MKHTMPVRGRPIIFSAPMVRALLHGSKTQTRRVVKPQPLDICTEATWNVQKAHPDMPLPTYRFLGEDGRAYALRCPYGVVGDILWVREAWCVSDKHDSTLPRDLPHARGITVMFDAGGSRAHGTEHCYENDETWPAPGERPAWAGKSRSGIFLPRWASRITLEVTGVRVERLQNISAADANPWVWAIEFRRLGAS